MIYRNASLVFCRFLHNGFRDPLSDLDSFLMIYDFLCEILIFFMKICIVYENLSFLFWQILMIFSMTFLTIHKIS